MTQCGYPYCEEEHEHYPFVECRTCGTRDASEYGSDGEWPDDLTNWTCPNCGGSNYRGLDAY